MFECSKHTLLATGAVVAAGAFVAAWAFFLRSSKTSSTGPPCLSCLLEHSTFSWPQVLFFLLVEPITFATGTFRKTVVSPDRSYAPDSVAMHTALHQMAWRSAAILAQDSEAVVALLSLTRPSNIDHRPARLPSTIDHGIRHRSSSGSPPEHR